VASVRLAIESMIDKLVNFIGGCEGVWAVENMETVAGSPLDIVSHIDIINGDFEALTRESAWVIRGVTSNSRYTTRTEKNLLAERQPTLARAEATCAALIPIRKSAAWWELAQDERREILETQSEHIRVGLDYLPAIARRLYHSRDLGEEFDFLTWFEYAPGDAPAFEELVRKLRLTVEWNYVEREIDIRLVRS